MFEAIVSGCASRRASILSNMEVPIVSRPAPDSGPFEVRYARSEASGDCGLPTADKFPSDGHPDTNGNADDSSVMVIGPFTAELTETKLECISTGQNEQGTGQTPPEKMAPPDVSNELSMRDYLMVLCLFLITLLTYGNLGALSVLTVKWLEEFKDSKSLILYVPSSANALMCAIGVIDGFLINRLGIFNIIIIGCFMQVVCVIGSSFSTNAITLVIVLGFLLGCALCFCYLNCFILIGLQFGDKGKYLIAALSLTGPLSGAIFPNLIPVFIEEYTWRGCMFIIAGIDLQMVPMALFLLLSQKYKKKKQLRDEARTKTETTDPKLPPTPKKTFDAFVPKDPIFIAYVVAVSITLSTVYAMYSMLPAFINETVLNLKETAKLYSIYSGLCGVTRLLVGLLQLWIKCRFIYVYVGLGIVFGLMCILINLAESYLALFVSIVVLSLCMGAPAGLYPIGILECVGPEKYSFGSSIVETTIGISTGVFSFLAGLLVEYMDSYEQAFCIYGAATIISNLCLLITVLVQNWRAKKGFSKI